jgi:hypothetical protein
VDTITVISPETGNAHDWYLIALGHGHNLEENVSEEKANRDF